MPEAKTAILTGGSGFLGSHFIKGLSKNHHSIYVLDTKPLDKKLITEFSNLDLEYFNVNVSEENEVVKDNGDPYVVYTPYSRKWINKLNDKEIISYHSDEYLSNLKISLK